MGFLRFGRVLIQSLARILIIFSLEARLRKVKSFLIQEIVVCFKFCKLARVGIISNQLDDRTEGNAENEDMLKVGQTCILHP